MRRPTPHAFCACAPLLVLVPPAAAPRQLHAAAAASSATTATGSPVRERGHARCALRAAPPFKRPRVRASCAAHGAAAAVSASGDCCAMRRSRFPEVDASGCRFSSGFVANGMTSSPTLQPASASPVPVARGSRPAVAIAPGTADRNPVRMGEGSREFNRTAARRTIRLASGVVTGRQYKDSSTALDLDDVEVVSSPGSGVKSAAADAKINAPVSDGANADKSNTTSSMPVSSSSKSTPTDTTASNSTAAKVSGTPRAFTLKKLRVVGETTRREVARLVTESSMTAALRLPTQREFALLAWEAMIVMALIALLRTGVSRTLRWIHMRFDARRGSPSPTFPYEQSVFECMQRPLEFMSIFTVGSALAEVVSRPLAATGLLRYIRTLRELGVIFAATWFLLRWIDRIRSRFSVDSRVDKAQVDATSRIATVITTVISMLISLDTIGVNVQTVLAFGGIGGVAIGFAGREIISNFFGGFMIFLTRPFSVGEWIRSIEEKDLNGTVEDIGWYLTRVRTWDKRPLYIPNTRFSTLIIENPSRMTNRRIVHTLHLRLEDMPVVAKIVSSIDVLLKGHAELDPKQHRLAYVDSFDEFSVQIWMSCYTKSVFLYDFRRVQQELLLGVYGIIRENGARLATNTTRDVRPGADPDRYGPLGVAASFRTRQKATAAAAAAAVKSTGSRADQEYMERNYASEIAAEIESGLFADEEIAAAVAASSASACVSSTRPTGPSASTPVHSMPPDAQSAPSKSATPVATNAVGSGLGSATPSEVPPAVGSSNGAPGVHSGAGVGVGSTNSGANGVDEASVGVAPSIDVMSMMKEANPSLSTKEALEMAAAAILAAQYNQVRSDERQPTEGRGSGGAAVGNEGSSFPPLSAESSVTQSVGKPGTVPAGSTGGGPSSDDVPPSGQMRISAAPPLGSGAGSQIPRTPTDAETAARDTRNDRGGSGSSVAVPPSSTARASTGASKSQGSQTSATVPAAGPSTPAQGQMNITAARKPKAKTSTNPAGSPNPNRDAARNNLLDAPVGTPGPASDDRVSSGSSGPSQDLDGDGKPKS